MAPNFFVPFLEAFLPNFIATVCGVALGLPAALYVNKTLRAHQQRYENSATSQRLKTTCDVFIRSLNYNKKILTNILDLCTAGQVMRNPDLQLTTWDTVGNHFIEICSDPEIIQRLSHHWLRLNNLSIINKEIFDRISADLPEIGDQTMLQQMLGELYQSSGDLLIHIDDLVDRLHITSKTSAE